MTEQGELFHVARHQRRGQNARALGTTLAAMRTAGLLERADEAVVVLARTTAQLLDAGLSDAAESRYTLRGLAAEHREALTLLRKLAPDGDTDDELLRLLSAPVLHTPHT